MFHAGRPDEAARGLTFPTSSSQNQDSAFDPRTTTRHSTSSPQQQPRLTLEGLSKSFGNGPVVDRLSLDVPSGSITGVIGRSGAGKSTLLRIAALLEPPDAGQVFHGGRLVSGLTGRPLLEARRRTGVVFQAFNLFSSRTAAGNAAFPLEAAGRPKHEIRERVAYLLDLVGLADKADRPVGRLSGGERQRVAIARALANEPEILFCDEATSALDPETTSQVLDLIVSLRDRFDLTVLMVTHQMEVVVRACDRVAVIEAGRIVEQGGVLEVFESPKSQAARRMVAHRRRAPENAGVQAAGVPARRISHE